MNSIFTKIKEREILILKLKLHRFLLLLIYFC